MVFQSSHAIESFIYATIAWQPPTINWKRHHIQWTRRGGMGLGGVFRMVQMRNQIRTEWTDLVCVALVIYLFLLFRVWTSSGY